MSQKSKFNEITLKEFVEQANILIESALQKGREENAEAIKESTARSEIILEGIRSDARIFQDQINELRDTSNDISKKLNEMKGDMNTMKVDMNEIKEDLNETREDINILKDEVSFIKDFLIDNLEPRIVKVESR